MKKKIMALALVVALAAIAVTGSLAWFTATDEVDNVFTVGSVKVDNKETNEKGEVFVQDQTLLPIVNVNDPASDANYIHKILQVENIGKNDAYVRTSIAIPSTLVGYLELVFEENTKWEAIPTVETSINGVMHKVYSFNYKEVLHSEDGNDLTDVLLKAVYMKADVDIRTNPATGFQEFCKVDYTTGKVTSYSGFEVGTKLYVQIMTEAVQADGFSNYNDALNATFANRVPNFN